MQKSDSSCKLSVANCKF